MFPDVFSGEPTKQEMQLNMFYDDRERSTAQPRPAMKSYTKGKTHVFGQVEPSTGHASSPYNASSSYNSSSPYNSSATVVPSANVVTSVASVASTRQQHSLLPTQACQSATPVSIPALRRVVKFMITSTMSTSMVAFYFFLNTLLVLVVPESITPRLGTLWGSFLYLWLLITITQMISHAVYMCSDVSIISSFINIFLVSTSALLLPRSLFMRWSLLAPCMSFLFLIHQCHLFCLVYSHLRRRFVYIVVICIITLLPTTQITQQPIEIDGSMTMYTVYSLMTIGALYGLAFTNNYKSEIVDISIGTSPLWQPDE